MSLHSRSENQHMIEFTQISQRYADGTEALKHINLSIRSGEFCVVLGPSGAGKSTLLRMLNGLAVPCSGQIKINGLHLNRKNLRDIQRQIAMIHQSFNLVPRMTVLNNVLSGMLTSMSTAKALLGLYPNSSRRRACELIGRVGLTEEHIYRRADELSGGQQQRVGIARAFMNYPKLVLADEPVASLDPNISHAILALLKDASREQKSTVLCSLHQIDLAREFADRIIGMRDGRIVFDGKPEALSDTVLTAIYSTTFYSKNATRQVDGKCNSRMALRTMETS